MSSPDCPWVPPSAFTSVALIGSESMRAAVGRELAASYPLLEFDLERSPGPGTTITDPNRLSEPDALIVCASVPLTPALGADVTGVAAAGRAVAARLRRGQLVLLAGPVPPGTTRGVLLPPLASTGLAPGRDFGLAYLSAPTGGGTARAVGGFDEHGAVATSALLGRAGIATTRVSSLETAEVCGAVAPLVRAVLSATANELKTACARMSVDAGEVIGASGVGGLLSADGVRAREPLLLAWGARRWGAPFRLFGVASDINAAVPARILSAVTGALNDAGRAVRGSRVALVGGTHITAEPPEPHLELLGLLINKGAIVSYSDPRRPLLLPSGRGPGADPLTSQPLTPEYLGAQDCVLIASDTTDFDRIVRHSRLVVDARTVPRTAALGREKIVQA